MFTAHKQPDRKETRGHNTAECSGPERRHDSPISSYLMAVPRFAFSSDRETEHHQLKHEYGGSEGPVHTRYYSFIHPESSCDVSAGPSTVGGI